MWQNGWFVRCRNFVLFLSVFFFFWIFRIVLSFLYLKIRKMQELHLDESLFDLWNGEKKKLNRSNKIVNPKPGEIRYIKIWINVWKEIFWKNKFFRPVLVINRIGNMFFCIPMTTKGKQSEYYMKILSFSDKKDSYLVVNQGRVFDTQRFFIKIGKVLFKEFEQIKKLLRCKYFPEVL